MGTIDHHFLMYEMKRWQIRAAIRGRMRRDRTQWESARFISLVIASINRDPKRPPLVAKDLITFPWEDSEPLDVPTEDEIEELKRMMREENEKIDKEDSQ